MIHTHARRNFKRLFRSRMRSFSSRLLLGAPRCLSSSATYSRVEKKSKGKSEQSQSVSTKTDGNPRFCVESADDDPRQGAENEAEQLQRKKKERKEPLEWI
ncbi:hypothetical protein NPIL_207481 [Nephila pilipes]|uniref:Uncharacterized protein n=1 Tax=Nephila pilipes TaxID=299642 RepID=A0A8X6QV16_NEPPI|nr:hypothetical protein NPIL_207481 [Nephila pilipes]